MPADWLPMLDALALAHVIRNQLEWSKYSSVLG
jgi:hypothetical protein